MNKFNFKGKDSLPPMANFGRQKTLQRNGYILITGATGLVGQYLLRDLFAENQNLAVLVRPTKKASAKQRIEFIMQRWENQLGRPLPRPMVIEGDLNGPNLGLTSHSKEWVAKHCDRIIHNAAILKFERNDQNGEPWKTNLEGTRHVLQFASDLEIREFHYISTAYVSGICKQTFCESDFDIGQTFRNEYEQSKFEAEKLVRQADGFDVKNIYRPAVIVGDSQTGFTASYHGLYLYLRLMATLIPLQEKDPKGVRQTPIRLPMSGNEPRNLVTVDWVSKVISSSVCNPEATNLTFNLVPDDCLTAKKLIEYCCEYFNSGGVEFEESRQTNSGDNKFADQIFENTRIYSSYDTSDPTFDKQNVERFCDALECPIIDRDVIFRYLDFGIENNWGKRKQKMPSVEDWMSGHEHQIREAIHELAGNVPVQFGLNVLGPGGGQWNISMTDTDHILVEPGLPDDSKPVLFFEPSEITLLADDEGYTSVWKKLIIGLTQSDVTSQNQIRLIA
ncbi:MAG: SDR family oxidoreductase [Planctomycetota bacterium]